MFLLALLLAFLFLPAPSVNSSARQEGAPAPQAPPPSAPAAVVAPPAAPIGPVIVLDPAHGGTDTGARGENGASEKDIVLQIARTVRDQLSRQGFHVLMTRNDDSDPSYDDRAAIANAHSEAIFVSLHVSSTGMPGSARTYYDEFSSMQPAASVNVQIAKPFAAAAGGLPSWQEAQRPHVDASHRLADFVQAQLAKSFPGSPSASLTAPVRALRSVTAPAVAIELSSISGSTAEALAGSALSVSNAISNGISAFRQANPAGAK